VLVYRLSLDKRLALACDAPYSALAFHFSNESVSVSVSAYAVLRVVRGYLPELLEVAIVPLTLVHLHLCTKVDFVDAFLAEIHPHSLDEVSGAGVD